MSAAGQHPARAPATSTWLSADELRTYLAPGKGEERTPAMTRDDQVRLLLRMDKVLEELAESISYVFEATASERASGQPGLAAGRLNQGRQHLQAGTGLLRHFAGGSDPAVSKPRRHTAAAPRGDQKLRGAPGISDDPPPRAAPGAAQALSPAVQETGLGAAVRAAGNISRRPATQPPRTWVISKRRWN